MYQIVTKPCTAALEEPQNTVWRPTAMAYPLATKLRQSRNVIGIVLVNMVVTFAIIFNIIFDSSLELLRQLRRHTFVGVDRKHPITRRQIKRPVFLRAKARPIGRLHNVCTH